MLTPPRSGTAVLGKTAQAGCGSRWELVSATTVCINSTFDPIFGIKRTSNTRQITDFISSTFSSSRNVLAKCRGFCLAAWQERIRYDLATAMRPKRTHNKAAWQQNQAFSMYPFSIRWEIIKSTITSGVLSAVSIFMSAKE